MKPLVIVLLLSLFTINHQAQEKPIGKLEIGDPAPDFNLPGTDGKNHSLNEYADFPILAILFTCNHCPTAQAYEDKIIAMAWTQLWPYAGIPLAKDFKVLVNHALIDY